MGKPVVLVSGIGGDIGQSVARALQGRYRIIGCDMKPFKPYRHFAEDFIQVPGTQSPSHFINVMGQLLKRLNIDWYIPVPEPEIQCLNKYRSVIKEWTSQVLINNELTIETFLDKFSTNQYLKSLALAVPKTQFLKDVDPSRCNLPAIIKSRQGCGNRYVWRVDTIEDVRYRKSKNSDQLIFQEYVGRPEEEYTSGVFSDGKKVEVINFRRQLGFGGLSREIVQVDAPALTRMGILIARSIGLIGSINMQSRFQKGKFYPFEINPRLSSTILLRQYFGFDDAHWWIQALSGESWKYKPKHHGSSAFRILKEIYIDKT